MPLHPATAAIDRMALSAPSITTVVAAPVICAASILVPLPGVAIDALLVATTIVGFTSVRVPTPHLRAAWILLRIGLVFAALRAIATSATSEYGSYDPAGQLITGIGDLVAGGNVVIGALITLLLLVTTLALTRTRRGLVDVSLAAAAPLAAIMGIAVSLAAIAGSVTYRTASGESAASIHRSFIDSTISTDITAGVGMACGVALLLLLPMLSTLHVRRPLQLPEGPLVVGIGSGIIGLGLGVLNPGLTVPLGLATALLATLATSAVIMSRPAMSTDPAPDPQADPDESASDPGTAGDDS